MPRSLSHAVLLTDDLDATLRFLRDVARLSPVGDPTPGAPDDYALVFGWPHDQAATRSAFVGEGAGMLEVVEIPEPLRGTVAPGVRLLAIAHRDAATAASAATEAGFVVRGPLHVPSAGARGATVVEVQAGGVPFELIQFG